ncbi:MAG: hypothetical protein HQL25_03720 [Candidatus Omnitrophica bacterium]|nr:hypothetical protein [Candidatus Omnitrophota bacterium]
MAEGQTQRKILYHINKYQKILFFPTVLVFMIGCMMAWLSLLYFVLGDYSANPGLGQLRFIIPSFLFILVVAFVLVIVWQCKLSNSVVGAFSRVIREMDEVLDGKRKGPIIVRQRDEMFYEIVQRVNAFIEKQPK